MAKFTMHCPSSRLNESMCLMLKIVVTWIIIKISMLWILLAKFSSFFFFELCSHNQDCERSTSFHQLDLSVASGRRHCRTGGDTLSNQRTKEIWKNGKRKCFRVSRSNLNVCLSNTRITHSCFQSIVLTIASVWLPSFVNKLHRQWCTLGFACLCLVAYDFLCQRGPLKNHQSNDPYWNV